MYNCFKCAQVKIKCSAINCFSKKLSENANTQTDREDLQINDHIPILLLLKMSILRRNPSSKGVPYSSRRTL